MIAIRSLLLGFVFALGLTALPAQDGPPADVKSPPRSTNYRFRPTAKAPSWVYFTHRDKMRSKKLDMVQRKFDSSKLPPAPATVDWSKSIDFPMYLNDQYGDCYYAAICHLFNTFGGNVSTSPNFGLNAIRTRYFALSGGDNGLSDDDVQGEMTSSQRPFQGYVADVPGTAVVEYAYIDSTDPETVKRAMHAFGVIVWTFSVPDAWIENSDTGAIWDAPARPNPFSGHAVIWNGVDSRGYYKLQTWGTHVWITPGGVKQVDPSGWIVFSAKWFNPKGYAPNGLHVQELARVWTDAGGKPIPANFIAQYPPPEGPTPPPGPPQPSGSTITLNADLKAGTYQLGGTTLTRDMTLGELLGLIDKGPAPQTSSAEKRLSDIERNQKVMVEAIIKIQEAIAGPSKKAAGEK